MKVLESLLISLNTLLKAIGSNESVLSGEMLLSDLYPRVDTLAVM